MVSNNWKLVSEEFPPILPKVYNSNGNRPYRKTSRLLLVVDQTNGVRMVKEGYAEVYDDGSYFWRIPGTIKAVTHWMPLPELPEPVEWIHSYVIIERDSRGRAVSVKCANCGHVNSKFIQFDRCDSCGALWDGQEV